jgi:hypothetical protein
MINPCLTDAIPAEPPALLCGDFAALANPLPGCREQYLYRVGSHATLMTVELFLAADGPHRRRLRFIPWPGL